MVEWKVDLNVRLDGAMRSGDGWLRVEVEVMCEVDRQKRCPRVFEWRGSTELCSGGGCAGEEDWMIGKLLEGKVGG